MKASGVLAFMMLAAQGMAMRVIIQDYWKSKDAKISDPEERAAPMMFELSDADAEKLSKSPPKDTLTKYEGNSAIGQFLVIQGPLRFYKESDAQKNTRDIYDEIRKHYKPKDDNSPIPEVSGPFQKREFSA